ncbi:MAG: hypothetical protein ABFS35_09205 [Bacteroidota bacterium]
MIEQLLSGITNQALGAINDHDDIPNNQIGSILEVIGSVTKNEVAKESASSGLGNIMNLFSDDDNNSGANSLQGNIMNSVISGLTEKSGLSSSAAKVAATTLLPMVLKQITSKNNATPANDSSPIAEIFGALAGGGSKGGILGGLLG